MFCVTIKSLFTPCDHDILKTQKHISNFTRYIWSIYHPNQKFEYVGKQNVDDALPPDIEIVSFVLFWYDTRGPSWTVLSEINNKTMLNTQRNCTYFADLPSFVLAFDKFTMYDYLCIFWEERGKTQLKPCGVSF